MTSACIEWTRYIDRDGYGRDGNQFRLAHRLAYADAFGPIPEGLEIDHLCRNRACVNPEHLEAVTHAENMARGFWAIRTHCVNGHEFTPENTHTRNGWRRCRACNLAAVRRYKQRRAQMKKAAG